MDVKDRVVWITGASSGIGEALVYACVEAGAWVIASARRVAELERVRAQCGARADRVQVLPLDLAQTGTLAGLAATAVGYRGRIDVLINNGGLSQRSLAHETPLEIDRRLMEVDYFGQVALTKAVLPYMLAQGSGHVAVVSSITGKFGFPLRSAYAAAKHALHGFFETLYLELYDKGIGVTVVCPGRIQTAVSLHALGPDGRPQGVMDPGQAKGMPARVCADRILRAIRRRRAEVYIGGLDLIMVYLKRYLPTAFRWLARRVSAR
ncbi:MAG: SDR family NAD(P)-dependent oxidoreductase [Bacteroidia bacterium]